jgi:hydrogenase nickel incorporation protein HypB
MTCGCSGSEDGANGVRITTPTTPTALIEHDHAHAHAHPQDHAPVDTLVLEQRVLAYNDHLAGHVRAWLALRRITAVNLMSSPGSGKTSLLERTIVELTPRREVCVIEGDQETTFDADRIERAGARAVQINTGSGCHLDAAMIERALTTLRPAEGSLLFVENVGNLVCPALFDIGEQAKVVVISVTEGDDKPLKYPHMFSAADLVVVNKADLLPHVDFDVDALTTRVRSLNPNVTVLLLSVMTGERMREWYGWLDALSLGPASTPHAHEEGTVNGAAALRP